MKGPSELLQMTSLVILKSCFRRKTKSKFIKGIANFHGGSLENSKWLSSTDNESSICFSRKHL